MLPSPAGTESQEVWQSALDNTGFSVPPHVLTPQELQRAGVKLEDVRAVKTDAQWRLLHDQVKGQQSQNGE